MNKSMQILPLTRCFFSIEGIAVLKFNYVAMLTPESSLEHYEIGLC